ncbi:hypothetical protein I0P70_12665 [Pontibacter sp. FD36]|uniref:DUF5689 domain-containing protein n=1 Tax=Pontibacter sp. FD36 TaxID=2789860 RepID=UPI0018AB2B90|nr:DUF5689 domain-containing protein [Pontibacter sp. FD36]MBF8964100.1 hypothetical protein [Pontibacter sp. FD36]
MSTLYTSKNMMNRALRRSLAIILLLSVWACSKSEDTTPVPLSKPQNITGLRKVQQSEDLKFGATAIKGIVISDVAGGNMEAGMVAVQEEGKDAAILLQLSGNSGFAKGDEVTLNLEGASLSSREGELVISDLGASAVEKTGRSVEVTPKSTTLSDIVVNAEFWGPILVKVSEVNLSGGTQGRFEGEVVLRDGIGAVYSMLQPNTAFTDVTMPAMANSYTGIVRISGDKFYINPRNIEDIVGGVIETTEDFEDASNTSYDVKELSFKTGVWTLDGAITAATSADMKNGAQSVRMQGTVGNDKRNGMVSMNFDLQGVKGLKVSHGIYPASAEVANMNPTTIDVEISKDGGNTFTLLQQLTIDVQSKVLETDEIAVNAAANEQVRIRFVNSSTPFANNNRPRINIDDVVFQF